MPLRTGHTYVIPGKGIVNTKRKTYSGKGKGPAGTRKVKAPTAATTPTVTTSPTGQVTTQNFSSPRVARQARKQARSSQRRVRRIERQQAAALGFHRRTQQRASERLPQPSAVALRKRDAPISTKTVISSKKPGALLERVSRPPRRESPGYKPPKFQGAKTAGTPSLKELRSAQSKGLLRTNKRGFVTTPAVRKTAGTLKRLESKARRSNGPLPGLTPQQSKVARTVLRRGVKAGATRKEKLAAAETGLVESGFQNLGYGDADSEGWRQERTSIYGTGATGPRNVKASADRFFEELRTDPGAATAPTAGQAAQAAQGSAFPERYDEVKPQANAIVKAFERGGLKPAQQRKLAQTQLKARKLGLKVRDATSLAPKARRTPTIVKVGKVAEKKFGLHVSEHPAFDTVDPVHTSGSYHYSNEAIDVSGSSEAMAKFDNWVASRFGDTVAELFYDPGISIDNGVPISGIGGHSDHVHVAIDEPGTKAYGLTAVANGLSPTGTTPFAYYGSGSTAEAAQASANKAKRAAREGKALTPTQKAHRTLKKLEQVGAGLSEKPSEGSESKASVLKELEARYGSKVA